jgi:hypothetical protein
MNYYLSLSASLARPFARRGAAFYTASAALLTFAVTRDAGAQNWPLPYSNYNWNDYTGNMNFNYDYSRYGLPGVGISPWNPILHAQLNLGMMTAQYNMYNSWANQAAAVANLYNQQAISEAQRNAQYSQMVQPRYDVRTRTPQPLPPPDATAPKLPPASAYLKDDGQVNWPESLPASPELDKAKSAAEAAIRVAVNEFKANGKATIQSVAEAKSQLFAFGKPLLQQLVRANRDEAKKLLEFFTNLEQVLNRLADE